MAGILLGLNEDDCIYRTRIREYLGDLKGGREDVRRFMLKAFYLGVLNDLVTYALKVGRQVLYALGNPFPNITNQSEGTLEIYENRFNRKIWGPFSISNAALSGRTKRFWQTGYREIDGAMGKSW